MDQFLLHMTSDVSLEDIMLDLSAAPAAPSAQYTPRTKVPPQKLLNMVECLIAHIRVQNNKIIELSVPPLDSKKGQILAALMEGPQSIITLSEIACTTPRSVSTYLSTLRREGHLIGTTGKGLKYI